jgi:hypothetical protein
MSVTISLPSTYMTIDSDGPIPSTLHANPHDTPPQNVARLRRLIPTGQTHHCPMHIAPVRSTDSVRHGAPGPPDPTTLPETEPTWPGYEPYDTEVTERRLVRASWSEFCFLFAPLAPFHHHSEEDDCVDPT